MGLSKSNANRILLVEWQRVEPPGGVHSKMVLRPRQLLSELATFNLRSVLEPAGPADAARASRFFCNKPGNASFFNEHSEQARAPHTNGPRDMPRCGAPSLLQKTLKNSI